MRRIGKFLRLPFNEKKIFFFVIFLLAYSRLILKFKTFKDILIYFDSRSNSRKRQRSDMPSARLVALLETGGNIVPFTTCLSKALAGSILMHRHGFDTNLHIGVAKDNDGVLEAHAWLSLDDNIIVGNCPNLGRFRELPPQWQAR